MVDTANRTGARAEAEGARQQTDEIVGTATRVAKSAMDEGERVAREAARRAARTAEAAANTSAHLADETARAAGEMSEQATDLARQGIETIQKSVENSLEITSRVAERSMTLFVDAAGIPTEETKEAADRALLNFRAMVDSGSVLMNAFQEAGRNWLDHSRERMKDDIYAIEAILRSRTLGELTQAQTNFARRQLEELITEGHHTSELIGRATATALRKIKAQEPTR